MPKYGTTNKKKATVFTIAICPELLGLLACNDSTHWARISTSSTIQASVRVDLVDVTL